MKSAAAPSEPVVVPIESSKSDAIDSTIEGDTDATANVVPMLAAGTFNDAPAEPSPTDQLVPADAVSAIAESETTLNIARTGFEIVAAPETGMEIDVHASEERAVNFQPFRELLKKTKPVTWVFAGDSITLGAVHTNGHRNYAEHFAERVRWELRRSSDVVINTATATETSRSLLNDLEWQALRFRPDVVSVMIGLNDAAGGRTRFSQFRRNLRKVVECIRTDGAIPLFHTPPHIDVARVISHAELRSYVKCVREVARDLDVACVDHWAHWKRVEANRPGSLLSTDGLHPTAAGHRELAALLFRRFGIFDTQSPTCAAGTH